MITVCVDVDGTLYSGEISSETYILLEDGAYLRNRPLQYFLYRVVKEYDVLNQESILRFIGEKWIL